MVTYIPNIIYLAPANAEEFRAMLEWGYAQDSLKVAIRIPTYSYEHADYPVDKDYSDLNRFKIIGKGEKVAVIGAGDYLKRGREVCDLLKEKGIDATLINPRFVSGVDKDMIESLKADHQLVATISDCRRDLPTITVRKTWSARMA